MSPALAPDPLGPTLAIGELLAEIVATTPGEGFREPQPLTGPYPSGAPAIFIDQCARMGGDAAMIGAVGRDDFGRLITGRLQRDGVDVSGVRVDDRLATGTAFVRYRADGARDFVFNMWDSAAGTVCWDDRVAALVARAGHLHVMGTALVEDRLWPVIDRAAEAIRARGGSLSLDPNLRKELAGDGRARDRFRHMLGLCDLLLPSGRELQLAAGLPASAADGAALKVLFAGGVKEVALKRGADGATCFRPAMPPVHGPAFAVKETDPTGAGDCFGGAYVACRRLGMTVEDALTYAAAAGARTVTMRGPMEGAGTRAELDAFIRATDRRQP